MHSQQELSAKIESLKTASATEVKREFQANGLNKLIFAYDPAYIPHVTPTTIAPQDGLHLGPDGLLRSEGAWLLNVFNKLGLDYDVVNQAISRYPSWPADVRIPPIHSKLKECRTGGLPKCAATLKMSGSQVMHFSLHRWGLGATRASTYTHMHTHMHVRTNACTHTYTYMGEPCAASQSGALGPVAD